MTEGVIRLKLGSAIETPPDPPTFLRERGKKWWLDVLASRKIDVVDLPKLAEACEELDNLDYYRRQLKKHGRMMKTRFRFVEHPASKAARDSKLLYEKLCRSLNLDSVPAVAELPRLKRAAYK